MAEGAHETVSPLPKGVRDKILSNWGQFEALLTSCCPSSLRCDVPTGGGGATRVSRGNRKKSGQASQSRPIRLAPQGQIEGSVEQWAIVTAPIDVLANAKLQCALVE